MNKDLKAAEKELKEDQHLKLLNKQLEELIKNYQSTPNKLVENLLDQARERTNQILEKYNLSPKYLYSSD